MSRYIPIGLVLCLFACSTSEWQGSEAGGGTGDGNGGDIASSGDLGKSTDGIKGCDPKTFTLKQAPPADLYLVLDRSGSMADPGTTAASTKWQELNDAVDFVLQQFESTIRFGLVMFPVDSLCQTSGPQVPVGVHQRTAVMSKLAAATPAGGTPTAAALNNAAQSLKDVGDLSAARFIILATDGGPNCNYGLSAQPACSCTHATQDYCCTSYPGPCYSGHTCLDETHVLQVIKDLHDQQKITPFVVGLEGSAEYKNLLEEMAKAGGAPQQGSTAYYPASSKPELQAALQAIAGSVISCDIDLGSAPEYPNKVLIYIDGKRVPRDGTKQNGWEYLDSSLTTIRLFGAACTTLQDGNKHTLTATFACVVN